MIVWYNDKVVGRVCVVVDVLVVAVLILDDVVVFLLLAPGVKVNLGKKKVLISNYNLYLDAGDLV